jgi:hypothetical protein
VRSKRGRNVYKSQGARTPSTKSNIVYDGDGIGSFLRGYLSDAKPFNNGASPIKESEKDAANYLNLKSQCFFKLSKLVNDGEIYVEDNGCKEDLLRELELIKQYNADKDGKLRVTPKDEVKKLLGRSPDYADMLMMRCFFLLKKPAPALSIIRRQ